MSGGVSSDIYRVETSGRVFVVKRALARLRVADEWNAPTSRNRHEADWLEVVGRILPGAAPRVLARDDDAGLFAMEYFDPRQFPVWKDRLRDGEVDLAVAAEVGRRLVTIHAATAGDPVIAERFATGTIFHAIRLEPYFEAAARRHPEAADRLLALSARTLATQRRVGPWRCQPEKHPRGPDGPVFLDAECAWYGDPAFDLAFCLNHLLLKCLWNRERAPRLLAAFERLARHISQRRDLAAARGDGGPDCGSARRRCCWRASTARVPSNISDAADRELVRRFCASILSRRRSHRPRRRATYGRRDWDSDDAGDRDHRRVAAAASGIHAADPPVEAEVDIRRRAPSGGRLRRPAPRPDRARQSICATAERFDVARRSECQRRDRADPCGRDARDQKSIDHAPDRDRRHAEQGPSRRQRPDRGHPWQCSMPRPRPRRAALAIPLAATRPALPLPGDPDLRRRRPCGATDRHPGSDGGLPVGALLRRSARHGPPRSTARPAAHHGRDADCLQGVADEGGYWPAFASNEEALDAVVRAIEARGACARARTHRSRWTSRRRSSDLPARTDWPSTGVRSTATG